MNRRSRIGWLTLAFFLSFGTCAAAFLAKANDAEQVKAASEPVFKIGSQDMLTTPNYNTGSYSGTATLDSSGSEYVLTLNNFNLSLDGPRDGGSATATSHVILVKDLDKNVIVNLVGTNNITNTMESWSSISGITFESNHNVTIQTDPSAGSKATLNVTCEGTGTSYNRGIVGSYHDRVIFQNVIVNADGGSADASGGVSNGIGLFGGGTINDGAVITATGASGAKESFGFKVANQAFYMNGGTLTGVGGSARYESSGLYVTTTTQTGGVINATADATTLSRDSNGLALYSTYTLSGGELYTSSSATSRSYGIGPEYEHGSTVKFIINSTAGRLVASGNTKAINCDFVNDCPGLGWDNASGSGDSETIETSAEARTIDYKKVDFRRMTYTAVANPAVDYDGLSHSSVSVSVTEPASGYTISYKKSEDSEYSSTVPSFTAAGTYSVDYKISASGYADRTGTLSFTINPLDAEIETLPNLAFGLLYDGSFHSLLATNGSASSGTLYYRVFLGGEWSTEVPERRDAGTYTVYCKAGGPNYNETATHNLGTVTISKANISNVSIAQSGTLTYNGSAQTPSVSASCTTVNSQPATYKYSDTYSASEGDYGDMPSFTAAGNYTVYYCITAPNHNSYMGSFTITIQKADSTLTVAPTAVAGLIYDGSSHTLINAGSATGGELQYKLDEGEYSTSLPAAINAGDYTVYYRVVGDGNHNNIAESSLAVSIGSATLTGVSVSATSASYTGSAITPSVTANATTVDSSSVTFTYSKTSGGVYGALPNFTDAGTHTIYYKANAANHTEASGSFTFTINKVDATYIAPTAIGGLVYTGSSQTLINAGSTAHGEFQYKLAGGVYSASLPSATNADEYTVYYKVIGDGNHNDSEESSLVVSIASAGLSSVSVTSGSVFTYDGTSKTPEVVTNGTTVDGSAINFTYSSEEAGVYGAMPSFTDAGTHTVYWKADATNHVGTNGYFTFTISKANPIVTLAPTIKTGLVYNFSDQELINAGTASGGTMVYRLGSYGWFDAAIPEAAAAGTYDVYYMVEGDANHNDTAAELIGSVTIAPAQFTNISVTATSAAYTGSAITPEVSASATAIGSATPEFTYSATSDGVYGALPSFTTAGVHTIYYKINASNHAEASGSFEFNITKTDSTFEAPTAISGLVVTGSDLTLINAGISSTGTLVYRLGETGEFSTTLPAVTEAGTYTIYYMVLGDENHNNSEIQSIVVTVAPAPSGDTPSDPPAPEPGTSEPGTSVPGTSEPGTPTNSEPKSFPVWAAVVIPVGGILLVFGLLLLLFFFALNKWVIHNGKPVRVYKIGKKDDKVKLLTLGFKVILKDESEIFDSKADALKLLK